MSEAALGIRVSSPSLLDYGSLRNPIALLEKLGLNSSDNNHAGFRAQGEDSSQKALDNVDQRLNHEALMREAQFDADLMMHTHNGMVSDDPGELKRGLNYRLSQMGTKGAVIKALVARAGDNVVKLKNFVKKGFVAMTKGILKNYQAGVKEIKKRIKGELNLSDFTNSLEKATNHYKQFETNLQSGLSQLRHTFGIDEDEKNQRQQVLSKQDMNLIAYLVKSGVDVTTAVKKIIGKKVELLQERIKAYTELNGKWVETPRDDNVVLEPPIFSSDVRNVVNLVRRQDDPVSA